MQCGSANLPMHHWETRWAQGKSRSLKIDVLPNRRFGQHWMGFDAARDPTIRHQFCRLQKSDYWMNTNPVLCQMLPTHPILWKRHVIQLEKHHVLFGSHFHTPVGGRDSKISESQLFGVLPGLSICRSSTKSRLSCCDSVLLISLARGVARHGNWCGHHHRPKSCGYWAARGGKLHHVFESEWVAYAESRWSRVIHHMPFVAFPPDQWCCTCWPISIGGSSVAFEVGRYYWWREIMPFIPGLGECACTVLQVD